MRNNFNPFDRFSVGARRAGGSAPFSPASLFANGEVGDPWIAEREWCYTKTLGGVYEKVTTSGDLCARWKGMVNGINADQDVIGKRPVYLEGGGLSWLETDGVDDYLLTPTIAWSAVNKVSVFAAVKFDRSLSEVVVETGTNFGDSGFAIYNNTDSRVSFAGKNPSGFINYKTSAGTTPATLVLTMVQDLSQPSRITQMVEARIDGVSDKALEEGPWLAGSGPYADNPLHFGARAGTGLFFKGRIYGIFPRGALTTAPEISAPENYLANIAGKSL